MLWGETASSASAIGALVAEEIVAVDADVVADEAGLVATSVRSITSKLSEEEASLSEGVSAPGFETLAGVVGAEVDVDEAADDVVVAESLDNATVTKEKMCNV